MQRRFVAIKSYLPNNNSYDSDKLQLGVNLSNDIRMVTWKPSVLIISKTKEKEADWLCFHSKNIFRIFVNKSSRIKNCVKICAKFIIIALFIVLNYSYIFLLWKNHVKKMIAIAFNENAVKHWNVFFCQTSKKIEKNNRKRICLSNTKK